MRKEKKERVGVLFGGRSAEHEVSVITGHQIMDALEVAGYTLLPIYITKEGEWFAGSALHKIGQYSEPAFDVKKLNNVYRVSLSPDRSIRKLVHHPDSSRKLFSKLPDLWADIFFPAIHGTFGEDGTLQGLFEMADVAYTGSDVISSALGMDKIRMKLLCRDVGIPVLDCIWISRSEWQTDRDNSLSRVESSNSYPFIVKPACLGSSIGVKRCDNVNQLNNAIEVALMLDERALVEPALTNFIEINCAVLGPPYEVSVCEQPCASETILTFEDKYKRGGKGSKGAGADKGMASLDRIVPAPISLELTSRIQDISIQSCREIGASGVVRIDFLLDKSSDSLYLNEINTMPGSIAFYLWEAIGLPFDELVTKVVNIGLQRHRVRSETQFSFEANLLQRK